MISKWCRKQIVKYLKWEMKAHAQRAEKIDELARLYHLENDQEFLDWQDSINATSVR